MAEALSAWPMRVRLGAVQREPVEARLEPDETQRKAIARRLGLVALNRFEADVSLIPWLDGAELSGWIKADVTQTCSITAEPVESRIDAGFTVRLLPPGSPNITDTLGLEVDIDAEAEDPPDLLESDTIEVSDYLVEHLALELDPFPRKEGAVFEPPVDPTPLSPFAALAALRVPKPEPGEGD